MSTTNQEYGSHRLTIPDCKLKKQKKNVLFTPNHRQSFISISFICFSNIQLFNTMPHNHLKTDVVEATQFIAKGSEITADWYPTDVCREELLCAHGFAPNQAPPCTIE